MTCLEDDQWDPKLDCHYVGPVCSFPVAENTHVFSPNNDINITDGLSINTFATVTHSFIHRYSKNSHAINVFQSL